MKKKVEGLGIILMAISFMLCFIQTIVHFYKLSKTLGFVKTLILSFLPFYAFPTYSVFKPIDSLVNPILVLTLPFVALRNPFFSPWTLGDWAPFLFCMFGAFLLGFSYKELFLGRA
jgi:hypothetical protein